MGPPRGPDDPCGLSVRAVTQCSIGQTNTQNSVSDRGRLCQAQKLSPRAHPPTGVHEVEPGGVRLLPDPHFLPKNQSVTFTPNEIFLPSLSQASSIAEDKRWCPVRALKWYIERTKQLRTSDRLFILPRSPYTPASKDTISRWMADLIRAHTQPGEPVRAHDVRGHATSRAWFRGVPLEDIMKAAAWKTPSSFVACYLTNTPATEGDFARAALGPPPARSSTHRQGSCVTNA
ncbi:hypothetical protein BSL78_13237 [Apostichopus japonicus]|uniref:Tyr recombinase domain-containing protein n=1 Tax=Stichopus japonicus TaxID=307972 RepID=A0A2G8KPL9_STIJA|nr:hypothetical protein BSL78_13237 [Apostichopus japonicus]